ncbi:hypothetical protein [Endozoicomonas sp. SCSIO W0465]|uniref:hypothetical protein n=1 Tax=Endozoicomonas sp. SCSIO W0465 TaxID=2918516 RepID=UPI002076094C|nr:hypothetical protein [Endozoicomonas sp. SCSIO W0465]USE35299.1 hypothetical protein MJO57_24845 [Endozoicomonas sp. SCSIO W0465]
MKRSLSWHRGLLMLPVVLVLCLVIFQAFTLLRSEVGRYQTELFLDHWQRKTAASKSVVVEPSELDIAIQGVDGAIRQMPESPALYVLKARVLERGRLSGIDIENNVELEAWQKAIVLRPAWPYSWSDYARARSQYSLIDRSFTAALLRANELGPWEPRVLENSALFSFHYRGWLSDGLQAALDNSYQKLVKAYPHSARKIAGQYQ